MLISDARRFIDPPEAEPIDGTPYLEDDFREGSVASVKGTYTGVPMRYHIHGDFVEFKQKDATYILDPTPAIRKVNLSGASLVVDNYVVKGKSRLGFYVLLDSGKLTLLEKKNMMLYPAQPPKAIETEGKHARYEKLKDDFYYKLNGGAIVEISSVKKILEALPDHQEEMKNFVSKEKISKSEDDLVKLARYYNQL
jgi:hypothetical protein